MASTEYVLIEFRGNAVSAVRASEETAAAVKSVGPAAASSAAQTKAAGATMARSLSGTSRAAGIAATGLRKLGTAAKWGALGGVALFAIEAKRAVDATQELTKGTITLHKNLGLSNEEASKWAVVARARNVDSTKLGMAFKTLASQVEAARSGSSAAKDEFAALGLNMRDLEEGSRNTSGLILEVADGLDKLGAGTERTAAQGRLFGRGWQSIAPLMRDGSDALRENLDLTERYGAVLRGQTLKDQEDLLAAQRESKIAWQGIQIQLASAVTPALEEVNKQFQRVAKIMADERLTDDEKFHKIGKLIEKDMATAMDFVIDLIPEVASRVGETAPRIAGALIKGFLDADGWGKLALGAWFFTKMGLTGAIMKAAATKLATTFGLTFAAESAVGTAAGTGIGVGGAAAGSTLSAAALPVIAVPIAMELISPDAAHGIVGPIVDEIKAGGPAIRGAFSDVVSGSAFLIDTLPDDVVSRSAFLIDTLPDLVRQYGSVAEAARNMSKDQRQAFVNAARDAEDNGEITFRAFKGIEREMGFLGHSYDEWRQNFHANADHVKDDLIDTANHSAAMAGQLADSSRDGQRAFTNLRRGADKMADGVASASGKMNLAVAAAMITLGANTNSALSALGVANVSFGIAAGAKGHQRGGHIPGNRSGDRIPAMLEEGEYVLNSKLTAAIGKGNLDAANFGEVPRFATGGMVSGQTQGLVPPFLAALSRMATSTHHPISVTSGLRSYASQAALYASYLAGTGNLAARPGTSHHELGIAADIAPGRETFGGAAGKFGLGFTVPSESWHIELLNAALAGMGGWENIQRAVLSGPDGAFKSTGQGSLDKVWHAANRYGQKKSMTFTGGVSVDGSGKGLMEQIAKQHGWSFPAWWALDAQETGHGTNLFNPSSGASLRAQFLPMNFGAYGPGSDPALNPSMAQQIQSMAAYIAERYGNTSAAWAHEQAFNWYQPGGLVGARHTLHKADKRLGHLHHRESHLERRADRLRGLVDEQRWHHGHMSAEQRRQWNAFSAARGSLHDVRHRTMFGAEPALEAAQELMAAVREGAGNRRTGSALSASLGPVLGSFLGGAGLPFAGAFGRGGIVPGPKGAPAAAIVHGGERIGPAAVNIYLSGDIAPFLKAHADELTRVVDRKLGRNTRQLTFAPGG